MKTLLALSFLLNVAVAIPQRNPTRPQLGAQVDFAKCKFDTVMCCFSMSDKLNKNGEYEFPTRNTDVCAHETQPYSCHGFVFNRQGSSAAPQAMLKELAENTGNKKGLYFGNIIGAPKCGCLEDMPLVTRADCVETDANDPTKVGKCKESNLADQMLKVGGNAAQGVGVNFVNRCPVPGKNGKLTNPPPVEKVTPVNTEKVQQPAPESNGQNQVSQSRSASVVSQSVQSNNVVGDNVQQNSVVNQFGFTDNINQFPVVTSQADITANVVTNNPAPPTKADDVQTQEFPAPEGTTNVIQAQGEGASSEGNVNAQNTAYESPGIESPNSIQEDFFDEPPQQIPSGSDDCENELEFNEQPLEIQNCDLEPAEPAIPPSNGGNSPENTGKEENGAEERNVYEKPSANGIPTDVNQLSSASKFGTDLIVTTFIGGLVAFMI